MKKLILIVACFVFISTSIFAQNGSVGIQMGQGVQAAPATQSTQVNKTTKTITITPPETKYYCPKCMYSSSKPGICPMDKTHLVQDGMYYCTNCGAVCVKGEKCPKCGNELKQITASYKPEPTNPK